MQNLNEPQGSDHQPQTRSSCIVFVACGSSSVWVCRYPPLRQFLGGFLEELRLLLHACAAAGQQTFR